MSSVNAAPSPAPANPGRRAEPRRRDGARLRREFPGRHAAAAAGRASPSARHLWLRPPGGRVGRCRRGRSPGPARLAGRRGIGHLRRAGRRRTRSCAGWSPPSARRTSPTSRSAASSRPTDRIKRSTPTRRSRSSRATARCRPIPWDAWCCTSSTRPRPSACGCRTRYAPACSWSSIGRTLPRTTTAAGSTCRARTWSVLTAGPRTSGCE